MLSLAFLVLLPSVVFADRQFTIINSCQDYSVWPAITTYTVSSASTYSGTRGWEATPGSTKTVTIPEQWNGRVWGRRSCTFDADGSGSCASGDCGAGLECPDSTSADANLIEINLDANGGGLDYWDISAVPGFTVPVSVSVEGCAGVSCAADLNPTCPDSRLEQTDANGTVVGCLSACMAGVNAGDDSVNCCSGSHNSAATCSPDGVDFYDFFRQGCEHAYAYPFDDVQAEEVIYTCSSSASHGYTIEFCPTANSTPSSSSSRSRHRRHHGDVPGGTM